MNSQPEIGAIQDNSCRIGAAKLERNLTPGSSGDRFEDGCSV